MISVNETDKTLSTVIRAVLREVNRGVWKASEEDHLPAFLPTEIQCTAEAIYQDGELRIRSMTAQTVGASSRETEESQTTETESTTENEQGGENVSVQVDTYEDPEA